MTNQLPSLNVSTSDYVTSLVKGAFGAIPYLGPIAAEIVGHIIPNQRAERIVRFVELLEKRIQDLEPEEFRKRCLQPDAVDLIEDALFQAARAKSQDRLQYIASIVSNGLNDDDLKQAEAGKMLWLLEQLSDVEVILLRARLVRTNEDVERDAEFREKHATIVAPRGIRRGVSWEAIEEEAIYTSFKQHLVDMGLLRPNFKRPRKGELPEFDPNTGMMKASGHDVTLLGKMLLRHLDLIPEWAR